MRLAQYLFAALISLVVVTSRADAQTDSARTPPARHRTPWIGAWGTWGLGSARFLGARNILFPPAIEEGWLTVGPVALGHRRVDAGAGINTNERIDSSWLLGARSTLGPLLLVVSGGKATISGRNSNGEQSGTTTPIAEERAWTAEAELSCTLGHYIGVGAATYRTGGTRIQSSGLFVILQAGRLR